MTTGMSAVVFCLGTHQNALTRYFTLYTKLSERCSGVWESFVAAWDGMNTHKI